MNKFVFLPLALLVTACQSTPTAESMPNPDINVVESRSEIIQGLDATYCGQNGFSKFSETSRYYNFKCKDNSAFRIPK
jgi:hypothetical protein